MTMSVMHRYGAIRDLFDDLADAVTAPGVTALDALIAAHLLLTWIEMQVPPDARAEARGEVKRAAGLYDGTPEKFS